MERWAKFCVLLIVAIGAFGCAGTQYAERRDLDGVQVIQGGRTGAFGTDNSWAYVVPPAQSNQPVRLEKTYNKSVLTWDGCADKLPNKGAKNIHREEIAEKWEEDVLPDSSQPEAFSFGVGNPSTGNSVLPAAVEAAGVATQGFSLPANGSTNIRVGGAVATGGTGMGGKALATGGKGGSATGGKAISDSESNSEINHSGNSRGGDGHKGHHDD